MDNHAAPNVIFAIPVPIAVSVNDAARILSVHRSTVYDMAKRGDFRMLKMGGRTIIPHADLVAYVDRLPSIYGPATPRHAG